MSDFLFIAPEGWTLIDYSEFVARTGQGAQSIEVAQNGPKYDMEALLKEHGFIVPNCELTDVRLVTTMEDYVFLIKFRVDPV